MRRSIVVAFVSVLLLGQHARALTVASSTPVAPKPALVAVNPIKNFVYVASYGAPGPGGDFVTVLDASGATPVAIGTIPVAPEPYGIDVNPLTNKIYVGSGGPGGSVTVIDEATAPPTVTSIPGVPGAAGVAVNPVTNRVYVMSLTGTLFVIDGFTDAVLATVPVAGPGKAFLVEVNPILNRIYVPEYSGGILHVIDGLTHTALATITPPPFAYGSPLGAVAIHPVTQDVYVTNEKGGVYRYGGFDHALKASAPIGLPGVLPFGTWGVEVSPLDNHLYVVQFHSNTVHVLDAQTLTPSGYVAIGPSTTGPTTGPHFSALNLVSGTLFVTNLLAGSVSAITDP